MNIFDQEARIEILSASGALRVAVEPVPNLLLVAIEIVGTAAGTISILHSWAKIPFVDRFVVVWIAVTGALALLYQFSGSETIEFGAENLSLCKTILGWERVRTFPVEKCSELEARTQTSKHPFGLRCKTGWRTLEFGKYVSESQADEILAALQRDFPETARKMGLMQNLNKGPFVRLGLG